MWWDGAAVRGCTRAGDYRGMIDGVDNGWRCREWDGWMDVGCGHWGLFHNAPGDIYWPLELLDTCLGRKKFP